MNRVRRAPDAGTARRWHIPPPLLHGPEPLEGGAVLAEVPSGPGLVLWQTLRDVQLWAETPVDSRAVLFTAGAVTARRALIAGCDPAGLPAEPLGLLANLLDDAVGTPALTVSTACAAVADWAGERGFRETELAFAQNAALASRDRPGPALIAARRASALGDVGRAEIWYRRAIGIARRAREWRPYTRAFSGLARLYQSRGNLPAAQRFHLRALHAARRGGLRVEQALALHDLFGLSVEAGRATEAERYARDAFAAYPAKHPRVLILAHDVAYFWMEQGHFSRALGVFTSVAPLVSREAERLWVLADLMRAAAGAGEIELARSAATEVRQECERPALAHAVARAQLELARGELQLGALDEAQAAAETALRLATTQRDGRTRLMAESVLESIHGARAAGRVVATAGRQRVPRGGAAAESLAGEMIEALRQLGTSPPEDGSRRLEVEV